jgi:hypothetical protein
MGIDVALIQPAFGAGDVRKLNICTPPLGLAYIAAFLREHGHRVTIIDAEVEQLNNEQIAQRAKNGPCRHNNDGTNLQLSPCAREPH